MKRMFSWVDHSVIQSRIYVITAILGVSIGAIAFFWEVIFPAPELGIAESSKRSAVALEDISTSLQQRQADARNRLFDAGYQISGLDFRRAIEIGDAVAVKDYCSLQFNGLITESNFFASRSERPTETIRQLAECTAFDKDTECQFSGYPLNRKFFQLREIEMVCGLARRIQFEAELFAKTSHLEKERVDACKKVRLEFRQMSQDAQTSYLISLDGVGSIMAPMPYEVACDALGVTLR